MGKKYENFQKNTLTQIKNPTSISQILLKIVNDYTEIFVEQNDYIIMDDMIYIAGKDLSYIQNHIKKLQNDENLFNIFKDIKSKDGKRTTQSTIDNFKESISKLFIQGYIKDGKWYAYPKITTSLYSWSESGSDRNEFNEMMNILYFDYLTNYKDKNQITYQDYLCALRFSSFGASLNIQTPAAYKTAIKKWKFGKFMELLLPDSTWSKSAELTGNIMKNSGIFSNKKYNFYSEGSSTYSKIFERIAKLLNDRTIQEKIEFDSFFGSLNVNKFFISDVLAMESNSDCSNVITTKINNFENNPSKENLKNIFDSMDYYFSIKQFIPISFKQVQIYSTGKLPKGTITEKQVKTSLVKIINPPRKEVGKTKYKNIPLDDYDLMLLSLIKKSKKGINFDSEIKNTIKIDKSTFEYGKFIGSTSYGGIKYDPKQNYRNFYFEFDLFLSPKKKKRYMFEVAGDIKIRTKGTASSTGEGGINTYSINYVLKEVYNGKYNSKLNRLAKNRLKSPVQSPMKYNKKFNRTTDLINYNKIMSSLKIINGATRTDSQMEMLTGILLRDLQEGGGACLSHFQSYCKSLKINLNIQNPKDVGYAIRNVCGKELGLIFDSDVNVENNIVKITFPDQEKNKVISSIWGLLGGRGPIVFEGQIFKTAKDIEDVTKYQIKLPALVKIGI